MSKSCFFEKFRNPGTVPGTRVPSSPKNFGSPKVVPEILSSSPWDKNPWDWQSRPMPIPDYSATALELDVLFPRFKPRKTFMEQRDQICESFHFGNTVLLIFRSGSTDVCFRSKLYHFFHRNGYIWDRNVRLCWVVGSQISKLQCCKLLTTFF